MWELGFIAVALLTAHLPLLAPSLEDIDSINFALGLRDFNPAEHRPHPPGYPVYIALGKLSLAAVHAVRPALARMQAEALALSICSVIAASLAIVCAGVLFRAIASERVARWATILLAVCPLFWMTAARPMSDMPGLAFACAAQALLATGRLRAGAFASAFALGVRSQTLWLTAPLLMWLIARRGRSALRESVVAVAMVVLGALAWIVPLTIASGGVQAYVAALGAQAGEDFASVDMLWANPTPRRLAFGLVHTFVMPWASLPLAIVILALAAAALLLRATARSHSSEPQLGAVAFCVLGFAPYAVFHLVFQETVTVRYALPLVAPIALLAAQTLATAGRATNFIAAPLAAASLLVAIPGLVAYGREPHPAFRAIADAERRAEVAPPAMLTSHFELRRSLEAADAPNVPIVLPPRQREWLELVNFWRTGGNQPVWFLANPKRTDLAAIDPHSRTDVVRYRWAVEGRPELSGTRPSGVDWYRLPLPGWFVGEGWSLTAEMGGITETTRTGPGYQPIVAYARVRSEPMHLMIGGRHLGEIADGAAQFELTINDEVRDRWTLRAEDRNFLRFLELPAGLRGAGDYALIEIVSLPVIRGTAPRRIPVAVRQFDVQPANQIIFGFGPGWHEDEYNRDTDLRWRWASDRSVLQVRGLDQPIRVRLRGESPLRYFDPPPTVTLSAAGRVFARAQPSADFVVDATIPADAVRAAGGDIVLETTRTFVPAETEGTRDMRRLGLRVFDVRVERAR